MLLTVMPEPPVLLLAMNDTLQSDIARVNSFLGLYPISTFTASETAAKMTSHDATMTGHLEGHFNNWRFWKHSSMAALKPKTVILDYFWLQSASLASNSYWVKYGGHNHDACKPEHMSWFGEGGLLCQMFEVGVEHVWVPDDSASHVRNEMERFKLSEGDNGWCHIEVMAPYENPLIIATLQLQNTCPAYGNIHTYNQRFLNMEQYFLIKRRDRTCPRTLAQAKIALGHVDTDAENVVNDNTDAVEVSGIDKEPAGNPIADVSIPFHLRLQMQVVENKVDEFNTLGNWFDDVNFEEEPHLDEVQNAYDSAQSALRAAEEFTDDGTVALFRRTVMTNLREVLIDAVLDSLRLTKHRPMFDMLIALYAEQDIEDELEADAQAERQHDRLADLTELKGVFPHARVLDIALPPSHPTPPPSRFLSRCGCSSHRAS